MLAADFAVDLGSFFALGKADRRPIVAND